jgi:lysophospholipase
MMNEKVQSTEFAVRSTRGLQLVCRVWERADRPPALRAFIIHGLGEHGGAYEELARFLAERSCRVYAPDLYGFGKSEGKRGHVHCIDDYLRDIHTIYLDSRSGDSESGTNLLFGQSMGALIALAYLEEFPDDFTHAAVAAPPLDPASRAPALLRLTAMVLDRVWPSLRFDNRIHPDELSSDQQAQESFREDELRHSSITPRLFMELVRLADSVKQNRSRLNTGLHLLFLHGEHDQVVRPETAARFLRDVNTASCSREVLSDMRHDLLQGPGSERTLDLLGSWLQRRWGNVS